MTDEPALPHHDAMSHSGTSYYTSLRPFRTRFETGVPILTYHKLGPRPFRVRLKGLYVSQGLFSRQLHELRQNQFETISLSALAEPGRRNGRPIILTFDDGFENVLRFGLGPLAENGFKAIQFLVANHLGGRNEWEIADGETAAPLMDVAQVREWLAAGHEIGSHTLTHPWLTRLPEPQARAEIAASKKRLEDCFGRAIEHFCYPYGDCNDAVRRWVAEAGYRTACTTEPGINTTTTDPLALKRFTARYPSRNLKAIWARWKAKP